MSRNILPCTMNFWRRFFWPGGVYYVYFGKDSAEILQWISENMESMNVKVEQDEYFEDRDEYEENKIGIGTYYKVYFRRKDDFVAFKLAWV